MNTHPHRQQDATPGKPFYSVCYQYIRNPWTLWSCNHYKGHSGRTQTGTSSLEVAKALAVRLASQAGIAYALVSKTTDCYNHETVFRANAVTETNHAKQVA